MSLVKVGVTGCAGRMGRTIAKVVHETEGVTLAGGTETKESGAIGKDMGDLAGVGTLGIAVSETLQEIINDCDVVIDFSIPVASLEHFLIAHEAGKSIVIGTTGFSDEQWKTFDSMQNGIRAVIAPNMSVGVNLLFSLTRKAAEILGDDYDVEIVEMHHNQKIDAPSGTAVKLSEVAADALGRDIAKVGNYGRHGQVGARDKKEIGVMTLRGGDVVGDHTVIFAGTGERVELSHKAGSRDNFAKGAVRAAGWIVDQKPGIYDMMDLLGLS